MLHHVGIEVSPTDVERTTELFQLLGFELVQPPEACASSPGWSGTRPRST